MKRWPALATEGTDTYTIDWSSLLPAGVTLVSVAYKAYIRDTESTNITFSNNTVSSNVSSVDITANTSEYEYTVKCTPTLSSGNISPMSVLIKVVQHVFG